MNSFYVYCSSDQVYNALTYNDIRSTELMSEFYVPTVGFMSQYFIFITSDKINIAGRSYGISYEQNVYPVTLELNGLEELYTAKAALVVRNEDGSYELCLDKTLNDYCSTDDCVGAYIYGHIPFSAVTGIIFETEENKRRFPMAGKELWFPEDIFAVWTDSAYSRKPQHRLNITQLKSISEELDSHISPEQAHILDQKVLTIEHEKAKTFSMLEASAEWRFSFLKTNIDYANLVQLDNREHQLETKTMEKLQRLEAVFPFINADEYKFTDPALIDDGNINAILMKELLNTIADHGFHMDKETMSIFCDKAEQICEGDLFSQEALHVKTEAIKVFAGSRISSFDDLLNAVQGDDLFTAIAFCLKNRGSIGDVKADKEMLSDYSRRYAYMIAGFCSGMLRVPGKFKQRIDIDRCLNERYSSVNCDEDGMLIQPTNLTDSLTDALPHFYLTLDQEEFMNKIMEMDEDHLHQLYNAKFTGDIAEENVLAYKTPYHITKQIINSPVEAQQFQSDFEYDIKKKNNKRSLRFDKELFLNQLSTNKHAFQKLYFELQHDGI